MYGFRIFKQRKYFNNIKSSNFIKKNFIINKIQQNKILAQLLTFDLKP